MSSPATPPEPSRLPSALGPLASPLYRLLWMTWLSSNAAMWMNEVAAAWMMTSIGPSPVWVALVQTASNLPVFLLGLPSGALADILDRKRFFLATQFWVALVAALLFGVTMSGHLTAPLLLALTFANGVGLALRWPVYTAILAESVPRAQLPQAISLSGVAMNGSRIIGPLIAGVIISASGPQWVFLLNAALAVMTALAIRRLRHEHREAPLGRESLTTAIRVGAQFAWQSRRMRAILLRVTVFFLHATPLFALLPLVARGMDQGSAGTYTLLTASMGIGAILAAVQMIRLRQWLSLRQRVMLGAFMHAAATVTVAYAPNLYVGVPAMVVSGMAWIVAANSLTVALQMTLPDWVRARGMAIYQMAMMGATAAGAAVWGQIATWTNTHVALGGAAVAGSLIMWLVQRAVPIEGTQEDNTPKPDAVSAPELPPPTRAGRIQVDIEYLIDPARTEEFLAVMEESRRSRLKQGALDWRLLHDLQDPSRYIEQVTDESWTELLRRFDRFSAEDVKLRERRQALHVGAEPPRISRYRIEQA